MRKIVLVLFVLLSSCSFSDQDRAESLVKDYLKKTLNDPDSYESVSFGKLEPNYDTFISSSPEGKRLEKTENQLDSIATIYRTKADSISTYSLGNTTLLNEYTALSKSFRRKGDSVGQIIEVKEKNYQGPLIGYTITHTFRAKNGFGALELNTKDFMLDSKLTIAF
ncbi:hypothetical protein KXD93_20840 [Mucilaginibacter sp. BJC16-A38]|uniref:hypothetical protein n=1 Tax=Mucilaginibacter phenanthrenivorans TaxID=1234842 RepID=UPI00215837B9|nr:hypothetical protein [Mucilaginibacter phenanthrenivorans]MCR8560111.1 hypothetical protein [Mucilaginibacter phenanthrenivorans]